MGLSSGRDVRFIARAPRTEPYVRLSRIRLPPWVCDGEAIARPRMKDDRFREPGLRPLRHPYPRDAILVAATPQRAPPEVDDMVLEHGQCTGVGRHCVIAEVATNDVPQPFPLSGRGWCMRCHSSSLIIRNFARMRSRRVFVLIWNLPWRVFPQMKVKPRKLKVSGLPSPRRWRRSALDEPGLLGMQCQRELP